MSTTEPKVDPRGLYGMVETARVLGINNSTLTRACHKGSIAYAVRQSTGKRVFKGQDIINYWRLTY